MKTLFYLFCLLMPASAYADSPPFFPIPTEVSEIVTWTHLCGKWIEVERQNIDEHQLQVQSVIDTTPALSWARANCGYEELESRIIKLQEKYKTDPVISYTLDNLIGTYKD
jgi:hypothetical protein